MFVSWRCIVGGSGLGFDRALASTMFSSDTQEWSGFEARREGRERSKFIGITLNSPDSQRAGGVLPASCCCCSHGAIAIRRIACQLINIHCWSRSYGRSVHLSGVCHPMAIATLFAEISL